MEVLGEIPFGLEAAELQDRLHIEPDSSDAVEFGQMLDEARRVARPKAVYKECYVEERGRQSVTLGGITFTSAALRANLDGVERAFAYVATCGKEIDQIGSFASVASVASAAGAAGAASAAGDIMKQYWLDTIKAALLGCGIRHLKGHLDRKYALGKTSSMSPGAGDVTVWPIEQQGLLFSLFGNVEDLIGVKLTDSFLMIPNKSVSGIRFPTEIDFRSCRLCRRENCPSRSAEFDRAMWESIQDGAESEA